MNNIKDAFDSITPTDEQRERMLSGIKKRTASPARRSAKWLRVAAIAAVLCCVFTMSVFAEEITVFIAGVFTNDAIVGDTVRTSVYTDTDGHIEMTVEEVLSDLSTVRIVVLYKAIDDEGSEWLSNLSYDGNDPAIYDKSTRYSLWIHPNFKENNTDVYGVSWSHDAYELEEYHTDTQRRFVVNMEADDDSWGTNSIRLYYGMTNEQREALIDASTNIEKHVYELDSERSPNKLYRPEKVVLSPLTIIVYGKNTGIFDITVYGDSDHKYYSIECVEEEKIESLTILFEDETQIEIFKEGEVQIGGIGYFSSLGSQYDADDMVIMSMSFDEPIDPETVSGIEIDGVFYSFE